MTSLATIWARKASSQYRDSEQLPPQSSSKAVALPSWCVEFVHLQVTSDDVLQKDFATAAAFFDDLLVDIDAKTSRELANAPSTVTWMKWKSKTPEVAAWWWYL